MRHTMLAILVVMAVAVGVRADSHAGVRDAVLFLMENEPGHPRKGDAEFAGEIADALVVAAAYKNFDVYDLVSCASYESNFLPAVLSLKKKGPAGEEGILQCGRDCKKTCPHFMDTVEGQAMCSVRWMDKARAVCPGSMRETLTFYASGQVCDANKYKPDWCRALDDPAEQARCIAKERRTLKFRVNRRVRRAERLRNRFGG